MALKIRNNDPKMPGIFKNLALQRQNKELLLKNEILSIQTEYLKKLDALVSEREKSEKKKSHRQ
jgi:hypothetical protein